MTALNSRMRRQAREEKREKKVEKIHVDYIMMGGKRKVKRKKDLEELINGVEVSI